MAVSTLALALTAALIPSLNADKINDGTFGISRIPDIPATKVTGTLGTSQIPNISTSKTTSGTFDVARVGVSRSLKPQYDALTSKSANTLYFITGLVMMPLSRLFIALDSTGHRSYSRS